MDYLPGMLVKAKKGRDKDHIYVITNVDSRYVYVADGSSRTVCHIKRKNRKHLQLIKKTQCMNYADDDAIKTTCLNAVKGL